jgi:amyloid beta precursor protein binding protein 1
MTVSFGKYFISVKRCNNEVIKGKFSLFAINSLWQASGQTALETAKVCFINGTATGCEILKDLVLPGKYLNVTIIKNYTFLITGLSLGIGSFTVVDGKIVEGSDVGNTFFLVSDSIGTNRAQAVTEFLQELNEDVKGFHFSEVRF